MLNEAKCEKCKQKTCTLLNILKFKVRLCIYPIPQRTKKQVEINNFNTCLLDSGGSGIIFH